MNRTVSDVQSPAQALPGQSLTKGAAGMALLPIEDALSGAGTWHAAHAWLTAATGAEISAADTACLSYGAPAVAFALHCAQADGTPRYGAPLDVLHQHVTGVARRRLRAAHARIDHGVPPAFAEYDLLHGLTGIGAYLLRREPAGDMLREVLTYLVRLTRPLVISGQELPGWWCGHDPQVRQSHGFPGGHANFGIAHGISGPLALLAQAARHGVTVEGQGDAMGVITRWLHTWRQDSATGAWWPQWITRRELAAGRSDQRRPARPSWCYGTPGLARAQQLAALALDDSTGRRAAETALLQALTDPRQLAQITDTSLCHGWAGLYQTGWRTAQDAATDNIHRALTAVEPRLAPPPDAPNTELGFLEGTTGGALVLRTVTHGTAPRSGWDAFLLI
ncbi:lanthionine synthetase C family protein [Streptomyces sp. NPDC058961]|uniref:lanthionine synthetase C family protein n=1 Tax=Streptomyces sp. NPDC058961 TaxID=3346680 RepID=UPI003676385F